MQLKNRYRLEHAYWRFQNLEFEDILVIDARSGCVGDAIYQ